MGFQNPAYRIQPVSMPANFITIRSCPQPHQRNLFIPKYTIEGHYAHSRIKRGHNLSLSHEQLGFSFK